MLNTLPIRRGSEHPSARFSPAEVDQIRREFDAEPLPYRTLAAHWGCSLHTIFRIVNRLTYRDEKTPGVLPPGVKGK